MKKNGNEWNHDKLCEDLALALGGLPFLSVPLGSRFLRDMENYRKLYDAIYWGENYKEARKNLHQVQMADVMRVIPSYTRFCVFIYEVKVSRSDFQSDLRSGKWRGYLDHCHRFMFAMPSGIAKKDEIPEEAGLIVRGPRGWHVQKAAPARDVEIPTETLLAMLFLKQRKTVRQRNIDRAYREKIDIFYWRRGKQASEFGKKVAKALAMYREYQAREERMLKQWQ